MKNRKKGKIEYGGKAYKTIVELAQDKGKKAALIYNRIRKGWELERAVESENALCTAVSYNGQKYSSIKEMSDKLNIPYGILRNRLYKGQSPDEAINTPIQRMSPVEPVTYMGTTYRSLNALANHLGISLPSIRHQTLKCGLSLEEAVEHCMEHNHCINLFGKEFSSLKEFAEQYRIHLPMLYSHLRNGLTMEEAVTKLTAIKPIIYKGKSYHTITDLCQAYGVQTEVFERMVKRGQTFEQALNWKRETSTHGKGLYYNGLFYKSRIDLCDEYRLNVKMVRCTSIRLSGLPQVDSETFLKAFDLFLELKTRAKIPRLIMMNRVPGCTYKGTIYNTLEHFLKEIGLSVSKVSAYKQYHGVHDTTQALLGLQSHKVAAYAKEVIAYPQLADIDFTHDFVDTQKIYKELKAKIYGVTH